MKNITDIKTSENNKPIKILQFGEGNFLRAFVDYMIDIANEKGVMDAGIAILKPIPFGDISAFAKQDNKYTVVLRGKENGKVVDESRIITSVTKVLDCAEDYEEFMALAKIDTLRFVISNTTEAGIVLDESDSFEGLPNTYPGKLTKLLYERFNAFNGAEDKGLIILPVELIENNGGKLKECVLSLADCWNLGEDFKNWIANSNIFCSTLVDRIVTGYPKGEAEKICEKLGYEDNLLDVGEPFALWVIESDKDISDELPLAKIGLPVVFTDNQKPYRERKVRVLNGAHTASVLAGYLNGIDIVRDCMSDKLMGQFVRRVVMDEIVPMVNLPRAEVEAFANSVFERFENPFIDHQLLSISLNSVSKWKARVLPSFKDYYNSNNSLPRLITFSFAALLAFYSSSDLRDDGLYAKRANGDEYVIHDDKEVLEFFALNYSKKDFVYKVASNTAFWGDDLTEYKDFVEAVEYWYNEINRNVSEALESVLNR